MLPENRHHRLHHLDNFPCPSIYFEDLKLTGRMFYILLEFSPALSQRIFWNARATIIALGSSYLTPVHFVSDVTDFVKRGMLLVDVLRSMKKSFQGV